MSYLRVFLPVFLLFGVVVAEFADTAKNNEVCQNVDPASEHTILSSLEKALIFGKGIKEKWFGKGFKNTTLSHAHLGDILEMGYKFKLIPPGLRWCGDGDAAENDDDYGYFKETDECCQAHDFCLVHIKAGKSLKNLKNNGLFTRSTSTCDIDFYKCLKEIRLKLPGLDWLPHPVPKAIGTTYFNVVRPQSFLCICPAADCNALEDEGCMTHCDRYAWVDNPRF